MARFSDSTRPSSDRSTKMITLDSSDYFFSKPADTQCKFEVDLESPLHISKTSTVYLESVYIGAFKINESEKIYFPSGGTSAPSKDVITHFNFSIPELGIITHAGSLGKRSTPFSGCFTLPNEKPTRPTTAGSLSSTDYQPYILGHLSRTAVYITSMQPKTLSRFTINITDQNGESIWKDVETIAHSSPNLTMSNHGIGNPPISSRRVIIQLIVAEND